MIAFLPFLAALDAHSATACGGLGLLVLTAAAASRAGDDRDAVLAAYLDWIDGEDDVLREAATRALTERRTKGKVVLIP